MKSFIIALTLLFAVTAQAQDTKIGYVDLNKALNESTEGKQAVKILEELVQSKQAAISVQEDQIKKLEEEITKQSSVLNPEAIKQKKDELESLVKNYKRTVKDSQEEVQKKQSEFMEALIKKLRKMVYTMGEKKGYSIIFERASSGILYIPAKSDLTEKLIEEYNASTGSSSN
ncbi:MAG: OmpH family outer membrane protein [Nitrospira sp.]|nr:OmpH family outer membrane protein [bacterium]MBL7048815.1 OmpH family outer membrane protein [Nitrospira sp.]